VRRGPYFNLKNLYEFKCYGAKRLIKKFSIKRWKKTTLNNFLKHLKEQCTNAWKCVSGRPIISRTTANTSDFNDLVLSRKSAPQTHLTLQQIAKTTGIYRLSVVRIIRDDLRLQVCEKTTRTEALRNRCKSYQLFAKNNLSWYPAS